MVPAVRGGLMRGRRRSLPALLATALVPLCVAVDRRPECDQVEPAAHRSTATRTSRATGPTTATRRSSGPRKPRARSSSRPRKPRRSSRAASTGCSASRARTSTTTTRCGRRRTTPSRPNLRTSIITDPPDGKIPPITAAARQREAARAAGAQGRGPRRQRAGADAGRAVHHLGQRRPADDSARPTTPTSRSCSRATTW